MNGNENVEVEMFQLSYPHLFMTLFSLQKRANFSKLTI